MRVVILMPLRDDWASAAVLIRQLDEALSALPFLFRVLIVDDASSCRYNPADFAFPHATIPKIKVVRLRRNLGHQRAIAIGLVTIEQTGDCDACVVMDSDGEDTPQGVVRLLNEFAGCHGTEAIFAERARRTESLVFRSFYEIYKVLHRILTGHAVKVGNFSVLPVSYLKTILVMPELWNHYAAALLRSKLPFRMVPIARGYRTFGESNMDFVSLVSHGLSAISVFGDIISVRLLIASLAGSLLAGLGIVTVIVIRIATKLAVPGWASYVSGILAVICIQLITMAIAFTFHMLSNRTNLGCIPLRDYAIFVADENERQRHA